MNYFVTAIGTDSGKTVVSAVLTEMLEADYWKPVQAGFPRDTETVQKLVSNDRSKFYQERYLLQTPVSPHAAAKIDKVAIRVAEITPPVSNRDLVIEGAGGVLVPLNDTEVVLDIAKKISSELVLVSNFYLGSINHTLLTAEVVRQYGLHVRGIIFNGSMNTESEAIILKKTGYRKLLHIQQEEVIDRKTIKSYAEKLRSCWD